MEGMDGRMSIGREGDVLRENLELQNEVRYLRLMVGPRCGDDGVGAAIEVEAGALHGDPARRHGHLQRAHQRVLCADHAA